MRPFKNFMIVFVLLIALGLLIGCDSGNESQASAGRLVEDVASDFTLTDMAGNKVSLSQFKGKVVILNFWATWCPPCREEMPSMEKLHRDYSAKGLVILAVNVDKKGHEAVARFLKKTPYSFDILIDKEGTVSMQYGVARYPESFIIDRNGVIVDKIIGGRDWLTGSLFKKIKFLLEG